MCERKLFVLDERAEKVENGFLFWRKKQTKATSSNVYQFDATLQICRMINAGDKTKH